MTERERMLGQLEALAEETQLLRGDVRATRTSFEARIRNGRRVIWMLVAVTLLSGYAAITSRIAAADAQDGVARIEQVRGSSRLASCEQDNVRIDQHNKLSEALRNILLLTNASTVSRTPEQQARADAFFHDSFALLDATIVAPRDCSPAGIDAYLTPK